MDITYLFKYFIFLQFFLKVPQTSPNNYYTFNTLGTTPEENFKLKENQKIIKLTSFSKKRSIHYTLQALSKSKNLTNLTSSILHQEFLLQPKH